MPQNHPSCARHFAVSLFLIFLNLFLQIHLGFPVKNETYGSEKFLFLIIFSNVTINLIISINIASLSMKNELQNT